MLSYHKREVQDYLLAMKKEYEETAPQFGAEDTHMQQGGLKSPPLNARFSRSPKAPSTMDGVARAGLPRVGLFSVSPNP